MGTARPDPRAAPPGGGRQRRRAALPHARALPPAERPARVPAAHAHLLTLQRRVGNRAVTALLARQAAGRQATGAAAATPDAAAGPDTATDAGPDTIAEDPLQDSRIAWVETLSRPKQETIDALGPRVNGQYRRIDQKLAKARNDAAKQKLTQQRERLDRRYHDRRVKNRLAVLDYFECTLGGVDAVRKFFADDLVPFMTPDLIVHKTVAARLEKVRAELEDAGLPMPATTVGQSLRGDHALNKRERSSPGMLAHAMGYAVDWRVYRNPHLKDPRLQALIAGVTGEETRMALPSWRPRRATIKAMGRGEADPDAQAAFLDKVGAEFDRLQAASAALRGSLSQDAKTELGAIHAEVLPLLGAVAKTRKELKQAQRRRRTKPDVLAARQAAVEEAKRQVAAKHAEVRPRLERIFKPWRDRLTEQAARIEKDAADIGVDLRQIQPEAWLKPLRKEVAAGRRKQRPHRNQIAGVGRSLRGPVRAVLNVLGRVDSFQRYLDAGAKGAKADDAARWAGALPPVREAAEAALARAEGLGAEIRAVLGSKPPAKPPRPPVFTPRRYSDRQIETWEAAVTRSDTRVQAALDRFPELREKLDDVVAAGAASADRLAAFDRANAEAKRIAGQHKGVTWQALQARRKRLTYLEKAAADLVDDLGFVFRGPAAGDPGVTQFVGAAHTGKTKGGGFFEPDEEPATDAEKASAGKQAAAGQMSRDFGFGKLFYQAMARHGFDLGAAWDNSQDTMHFELVEGVESIKDPDSCATE